LKQVSQRSPAAREDPAARGRALIEDMHAEPNGQTQQRPEEEEAGGYHPGGRRPSKGPPIQAEKEMCCSLM